MTLYSRHLPIASNHSGSVGILFGLSVAILTGIAGMGLDVGRQRLARTVTMSAMDSAVLAGTRWLQMNPGDTAGAVSVATKYYAAGTAARIPVESDTVQFVTADNGTAVTAQGNAYIKTTLLNVIGVPRLPVVDSTSAAFPKAAISVGGRGGSNVELSVMLDVTGSMCDDGAGPCTTGTKITGLKSAVSDLVNIVVQADQSVHTSKVALVPFSTRIRVGPDGGGKGIMKQLTNLDDKMDYWYNVCTNGTGSGSSETSGNWSCSQYTPTKVKGWQLMPCVTERAYNSGAPFDTTDDAPGPGKWLNAHGGDRSPVAADSSDTPLGNNNNNNNNNSTGNNNNNGSGTGSSAADPSTDWNYTADGACADILAGNDVQPLTSDKPTLLNRINALQAYGGTAGALATSWSWYMLSPNWANIWKGNSKPAPYSDLTTLQVNGSPKLRKVAVLMTDGGFDAYRSGKDQDQQMISNYAIAACSAMKAKGIEIYTVGFALNQLPANQQPIALATLQACGTDLAHFYQSLTVSDLQTAFRSIAVQLAGLRLTQ